jgi:nanoRNase/pAp phosphatase (c-di-AMP/oligoRNAs hydrolase)
MNDDIFRLITRSDFDGLVCAMLLRDLNLIDEIKFVHPKDMQDGTILVSDTDITTNLPYVEGVYLAFDHHSSEIFHAGMNKRDNYVVVPDAQSTARVVYNHYGGEIRFSKVSKDLLAAVDQAAAAHYNKDDILNAASWSLLNFLIDPRTGLGRFHEFSISNYNLMIQLIDYFRHHSVDEILNMSDVRERVDLYMEHLDHFKGQILKCSTVTENIVVLDLRGEEAIYAGNRFMIYALFPETNISINIMWGANKTHTVFATGKSIINRSSNTNIGALMLKYGGGGHFNAGTCQVENGVSEQILDELIEQIVQDG